MKINKFRAVIPSIVNVTYKDIDYDIVVLIDFDGHTATVLNDPGIFEKEDMVAFKDEVFGHLNLLQVADVNIPKLPEDLMNSIKDLSAYSENKQREAMDSFETTDDLENEGD